MFEKIKNYFSKNQLNESTDKVINEATLQNDYSNKIPMYQTHELENFGTFVYGSFYDTGAVFGRFEDNPTLSQLERSYIYQQRVCSLNPDVALGIEEIFSDLYDKERIWELKYNGKDKTDPKVLELFEKFKKEAIHIEGEDIIPQQQKIFNFIKQIYIDGQYAVYVDDTDTDIFKNSDTSYFGYVQEDEAKPKIRFIPLDPALITYNDYEVTYQFYRGATVVLDPKKILRGNFGNFDQFGACFGFLRYAFKYANQLQSLQDTIVPIRFKRSVTRRVFNVDIGELPQGRSKATLEELRKKFQYKKSYDATTGKIVVDNQSSVGLTEDYWFSHRNGEKGLEVQLLDESGNINDTLDDVMYFNKRLYQSMFIPLRRIFQSDSTFDYNDTSIEVDEKRFNSFLSRVRLTYNALFTSMFVKYITKNGIEEEEAKTYVCNLTYDNWFEESTKREQLEKGMELFETAKEQVLGKNYSAESLLNICFKQDPTSFRNEQDKIKTEVKKNSIYAPLYADALEDD